MNTLFKRFVRWLAKREIDAAYIAGCREANARHEEKVQTFVARHIISHDVMDHLARAVELAPDALDIYRERVANEVRAKVPVQLYTDRTLDTHDIVLVARVTVIKQAP